MQVAGIRLPVPPAEAASRIAELAGHWGGDWAGDEAGGRLELPVVFGLRRGVAAGQIAIAPEGGGSRVDWRLLDSHLEVHRSSVIVLSLAAVPSVALLGWPFFPALIALAPLAAVLGFLAWWLVVARLRSAGPEEFFAALGTGDGDGDARAARP
jgi:hypothetical protein